MDRSSPTVIVAVIQARMRSTRLPGKVLLDLAGAPMLARVVDRALAIEGLDDVAVATSTDDADDPIEEWCVSAGCRVIRGSGEDVLDRYLVAARAMKADHVMRITADCPLVCPTQATRVVERHLAAGADYTHNITVWGSGMPLGTGVELFTFEALERSWQHGHEPHHREHVDEYIGDNRDEFHMELVTAPNELCRPNLRLTVDTDPDLALVRAIHEALQRPTTIIKVTDVVTYLDQNPALLDLNSHIVQKTI